MKKLLALFMLILMACGGATEPTPQPVITSANFDRGPVSVIEWPVGNIGITGFATVLNASPGQQVGFYVLANNLQVWIATGSTDATGHVVTAPTSMTVEDNMTYWTIACLLPAGNNVNGNNSYGCQTFGSFTEHVP